SLLRPYIHSFPTRRSSDLYDRELDGAFALQDEIARSIVDGLKIKFGVRVSAHEQPSSGVYDRYLQGLFADVTHPTGASSIGVSRSEEHTSELQSRVDLVCR